VVLKRLAPHPRLAPFIEKMWLFQSATGIPPGDMRTVVPNGLAKMIVSFRGSLRAARAGTLMREAPEASICLIGLTEQPVTIDSPGPTGSIGVELRPGSAWRFFPCSLGELKNRVELSPDVLGRAGAELQRRVEDSPSVEGKVAAIERFLLERLDASPDEDPVVEWAVREIRRSAGMVSINDPCERLGYSKRYLDLRFADHVGLSPKLFASINRFLFVFRHFAQREPSRAFAAGADPYYDLSHFIREFKRFAGRSPRSYLKSLNDFGEIFYRGT
jgi:AraC-like DNA-binding protein